MDQIAKRAGASTKTLYSRFDNKSGILEAVVRRNVQRTVADHLRSFVLRPAESDPREFLFKFGMQIGVSALTDETAGLSRVTFAEAHRFPVLARLYKEVTGQGVTAIAEALRIWREQGKVEFELDAVPLAALCFDMMTSEARARAVIGDPWSRSELERYVTLAVDVFLRGIEADAGNRRSKRK
jgi:AcrR family transcriptional regulator